MSDGKDRRWNHYTCDHCHGVTISTHEQEGVTPFMVGCRATPGCLGFATSGCYRGSQSNEQRADIVWYRPATEDEAIAEIVATVPTISRAAVLEHWRKGGCLMREVPRPSLVN